MRTNPCSAEKSDGINKVEPMPSGIKPVHESVGTKKGGEAHQIVLPSLDNCIHSKKLAEKTGYGFKASFNPSHPGTPGNPFQHWVSPWHCGLN